jgi:hypothetical protein
MEFGQVNARSNVAVEGKSLEGPRGDAKIEAERLEMACAGAV